MTFGAVAVALALAAAPASAGARLEVVDAAGAVAMTATLGEGGRWCLVWNHSVTGIEVSDCFVAERGVLVLERSHQPDFAAGLGEIPGRGTVVSDDAGGYWIEDIDWPMPGGVLPLRVGSGRVDHRLLIGRTETSLSARWPGARVTIRLAGAGS